MLIYLFSLFFSPIAQAQTTAPSVHSVIQVVGEAKDHFLTTREVRINDAIEQVLTSKAENGKALQVLTGSEKSFPQQVNDVLVEWIIYFEAQSFSAQPIDKVDLQKSEDLVKTRLSPLSDWKKMEVSDQELRETLSRKLTAKSFMKLKTESSLMPVTDADALDYYKKNRVKFGNAPFENFQENIKNYLKQQQMDRRMKDWLEVLERKYKVRNFIAG
jgi:hypothetical protein